MELFLIKVNGFRPLYNVTRSSVLVVFEGPISAFAFYYYYYYYYYCYYYHLFYFIIIIINNIFIIFIVTRIFDQEEFYCPYEVSLSFVLFPSSSAPQFLHLS